jgi:hypothetical protein
VEASSVQEPIERHEAEFAVAEKRPYQKPELTKHQKLSEVTLGIQCTLSAPACSPVQDPFG